MRPIMESPLLDQVVSLLLERPHTAREITALIYGPHWTGRQLWRVAGAVDTLIERRYITRCGTSEDGRPEYMA